MILQLDAVRNDSIKQIFVDPFNDAASKKNKCKM